MSAAIDVVAMLLTALTLLPMTRLRPWWIKVWDFPRSQIVVLGALTLTGGALVGMSLVAGCALLAAMAWQATLIVPYTPLWPARAAQIDTPCGSRTLSLLVANVLMTNRETERLAGLVREHDPDIVLALETDTFWSDALAEMLPDHRWRALHPLDNTYGLVLFSRLELIDPEIRFLVKPDIPSVRTKVRLRSGETVVLIGLHPEPPAPGEADTSLPRDAELVLVGRELAGGPEPVIVAGDLNDVAWSHTSRLFRRLAGLLDPRVGRGFYSTFHAGWPGIRWPLDHVFYSPQFTLRSMRRLPAFGSDHFPILVVIDYQPAAAGAQEPDAADQDDRVEARETLAAAREEAVAEMPAGATAPAS